MDELSEREILILYFLNEFGFCEIRQIMIQFKMKQSTAYHQMKLLERLGLVSHHYVVRDKHGVYCATAKAVRLLDMNLAPLTRISPNVYAHQLSVVNVYLKLKEQYPDSAWISERRLIKEKYSRDLKKDHLPDGALILKKGASIAIEVERVLKSRTRLEEIIYGYALQEHFNEVWYFCARGLIPVITEISKKIPFIKIYALEELLK